jgi:hypothetical protein
VQISTGVSYSFLGTVGNIWMKEGEKCRMMGQLHDEQSKQCTYDVTLRRVLTKIVAVEKQ